jgi:hypothetical protein
MIPFLTYPLALIALASVPALVAVYVLRNRFRRRTVSSLVLWRFRTQSKTGGAKIHRLQLPWLFFLELLALVLLVTAAAGPHWRLPQSERPLIVILDDSFSMRAMSDGASARDRARAFLEKLCRRSAPPSTRLILAGTEARSLGAPVRNGSALDELLRQWNCWSPTATLDSAISLATELGRQQANILVLTDHRPAVEKILNPRLEWHAFGKPLDNFAIVNAARTAFGEQDRCLLEVANFSGQARATKLLVQTGSNTVQSSVLPLGAHENRRLVFNVPATTPELRVFLEDDPLDVDNAVRLLPPIRKRVRVQVALADEKLNALVTRTLAATGLRAALSENPELVIHETDTLSGSNSWNLYWTGITGTNAFVGPFVLDSSHPLAAGIALEGAVWAGSGATNSPGNVPVVLAGNTPLLSARTDVFGRRHLTLNFNPELSTLQNTPDWPILFWNLLQWRAAETPGLKESNVRLGVDVLVKTTGEPVTVTQPDGAIKSFPKTGGDLALETPMPGLYSISLGPVTNAFVVNPLAADESDLTACVNGQWGTWGETTERRMEESSVVWIFGLLAAALLVAHLFLLTTGKGAGR